MVAEQKGKSNPKIMNLATIVFLVFAFILIFCNGMEKTLQRDENMYCTAGVLVSQGKTIYKDFSYVTQFPYHPLLLAVIYKITGTTYYLLTARIVSCIADFLTCLFIILIYRKVFSGFHWSGFLLGLAAVMLFLFNPVVNYITGVAWNHNIVICLVAASFWIYFNLETACKRIMYIKIALIAALLSFASCMRITTVLIELLFFMAIIFRKYEPEKERKICAAIFIISSAVVFVWPVWIILQAPKAFWIDLIVIPRFNSVFLSEIGQVFSKLRLTIFYLITAEFLFPILIAIYLYTCMFRRLTLKKLRTVPFPAIFLPIIFFIIIYIPPTIWDQYFAPPVPFLLISLAFPLYFFRQIPDCPHFKIASSLMATCVLISIVQQAAILKPIVNLNASQRWQPVRLHNNCRKIAQAIDKEGPVLTVSPLYALEGGRQIYPQLASGLFTYRVADNITSEQKRITNTVGPDLLRDLIKDNPPAAVIVGTEKVSVFERTENTLLQVIDADWRRLSFGDITLFTKP